MGKDNLGSSQTGQGCGQLPGLAGPELVPDMPGCRQYLARALATRSWLSRPPQITARDARHLGQGSPVNNTAGPWSGRHGVPCTVPVWAPAACTARCTAPASETMMPYGACSMEQARRPGPGKAEAVVQSSKAPRIEFSHRPLVCHKCTFLLRPAMPKVRRNPSFTYQYLSEKKEVDMLVRLSRNNYHGEWRSVEERNGMNLSVATPQYVCQEGHTSLGHQSRPHPVAQGRQCFLSQERADNGRSSSPRRRNFSVKVLQLLRCTHRNSQGYSFPAPHRTQVVGEIDWGRVRRDSTGSFSFGESTGSDSQVELLHFTVRAPWHFLNKGRLQAVRVSEV
ncbi:hypothetical protein B0T17DRAFT_506680 [Bombardia bombarda]|uniref:Uncharacterized protein n=1 Tax=Bombardia bombarda TaxID=252184 RepID=A0AA39XAK3_9PEZI|nr:hypothetical protein B0T17DRAFT_506680 [Bombardia bombarda]